MIFSQRNARSIAHVFYLKPCRNGKHLANCSAATCPHHFKCSSSYCIPIRYTYDGKQDCPVGDDEQNCHNRTCQGQFKCKSSGKNTYLTVLLPLVLIISSAHPPTAYQSGIHVMGNMIAHWVMMNKTVIIVPVKANLNVNHQENVCTIMILKMERLTVLVEMMKYSLISQPAQWDVTVL